MAYESHMKAADLRPLLLALENLRQLSKKVALPPLVIHPKSLMVPLLSSCADVILLPSSTARFMAESALTLLLVFHQMLWVLARLSLSQLLLKRLDSKLMILMFSKLMKLSLPRPLTVSRSLVSPRRSLTPVVVLLLLVILLA